MLNILEEVITIYPNGTIVILKNANKKLMIYGRNQKRDADNNIYDYVSCFYPEGYLSPLANVFFNSRDIKQVIFEGFCDLEEKSLVENMMKENYRNKKGIK